MISSGNNLHPIKCNNLDPINRKGHPFYKLEYLNSLHKMKYDHFKNCVYLRPVQQTLNSNGIPIASTSFSQIIQKLHKNIKIVLN